MIANISFLFASHSFFRLTNSFWINSSILCMVVFLYADTRFESSISDSVAAWRAVVWRVASLDIFENLRSQPILIRFRRCNYITSRRRRPKNNVSYNSRISSLESVCFCREVLSRDSPRTSQDSWNIIQCCSIERARVTCDEIVFYEWHAIKIQNKIKCDYL